MTSAAKAANQNKALNAALEALRHPKPVQNQVFQQPARDVSITEMLPLLSQDGFASRSESTRKIRLRLV
jgi:hypothetical protein